mgnify:CR=1 FL=1
MEIGNIVLILVLAIVLFPRLSADYVLHQFVIIVLLTMGLSLEMLSGVFRFRIYGGNRNDDMPGRTMPAGRVSGLGELNGYDTGTDAVRDGKGASDW